MFPEKEFPLLQAWGERQRLEPCRHPRLIPGIEAYCPDCKKSFVQLDLFSQTKVKKQKKAKPKLQQPNLLEGVPF